MKASAPGWHGRYIRNEGWRYCAPASQNEPSIFPLLPRIIRAAFFHMRQLRFREQFVGQDNPVQADHGPALQCAFEVGIYIVPLHRGQIINNVLAHFC